jgi:glucan 1,3-beta-glucosidase
MKRAAVMLAAALGAAAALAWWLARAVPVPIVDAPQDRVPCVSYAPYRLPGESPLVRGYRVSPARIDADLALLASRTACIRTYSVDQGLDEAPRLARKHGLRVLLGLWIGRDAAENEAELARGLAVLKRDADVIDAVVVGNEVLLRREQPPAGLRAYLERVRAATPVPVTYADVWEFWLRNPALAEAVSFVTVHMLPYWEDDPVPVDRAVDHVVRMHARVREALPGRPILIGEVGWPSRGRRREGAVPSLVNQARFVREFAIAAERNGLRYNVIEAFDQPWKRRLEGTVGGHWGMDDSAGRAKFPLRGPVAEAPDWRPGPIGAVLGAVAFVALGVLRTPRPGAAGATFLAFAGAAAGALLARQVEVVKTASRDAFEWAVGAGFTAAAALACLLCALALARWLAGERPAVPAAASELARWFRTNVSRRSTAERWLGTLRFVVLFAAALVSLLLAFDPRYRDFPLAGFAAPAVGFALVAWVARGTPGEAEERWLALVLVAAAPVILWRETPTNVDALAWIALCGALAASVARARQHKHPEQEGERAGHGAVEDEPDHPEARGGERPTRRARQERRERSRHGDHREAARPEHRDRERAWRAPRGRTGRSTQVHDRVGLDERVADGGRGGEGRRD